MQFLKATIFFLVVVLLPSGLLGKHDSRSSESSGSSESSQRGLCPPNEFENSCASSCPITCQNRDKPRPCPPSCIRKCDCIPGYLRDMTTGRCVEASKCPPVVCGSNEVFNTCASSCQITCQNKDQGQKQCDYKCNQLCVCKPGYIRDEISRKCVELKECPSKNNMGTRYL